MTRARLATPILLVLGLAASLTASAERSTPPAPMVLIPAGPFPYGINGSEVRNIVKMLRESWADIYNTEHAPTTVTLPAFYMDTFEVTNEQFTVFQREQRRAAPRYSRFPQFNGPRQPVVGVSWRDADAFCRWAGKRLPSEEEWEKAARGTDGRIWPWGNQADAHKYNGRAQANYAPVNVGKYPSGNSPYGVSDMAGNVWEMTTTIWDATSHVMRGGSFLNTDSDVRTTARWAPGNEVLGTNWLGFRCVMDPRSPPAQAK